MRKLKRRTARRSLAVTLALASTISAFAMTGISAYAVDSTSDAWNTTYVATAELSSGVATPRGKLTVKGVAQTNGLSGTDSKDLIVVAHKVYDFKRNATTGEITVERTNAGIGFTAQTGKTEYGNPTQASVASVAGTFANNQADYKSTSVMLTRQENGDYVAENCPAGMYLVNVYNTSANEWYNPLLLSINMKYGTGTGASRTTLEIDGDAELGTGGRFGLMLNGEGVATDAIGYAKKGSTTLDLTNTAVGAQTPQWKIDSVLPDYVGYTSPSYTISFTDPATSESSIVVKIDGNPVTAGITKTTTSVTFDSSIMTAANAKKNVEITYAGKPFIGSSSGGGSFDLTTGTGSYTKTLSSGNNHDNWDTSPEGGDRQTRDNTATLVCSSNVYDSVTLTDVERAWHDVSHGSSVTVSFKIKKVDEDGNPLANATFKLDGGDAKQTDGNGFAEWTGKISGGTIRETEAPFGYAINDEANMVLFTNGVDNTGNGTITASYGGHTFTWTVTNGELVSPSGGSGYYATLTDSRLSLIELPTTGGVGTIVFTGAVAGVLGLAFFGFVKSRKKANEE